MQTRSLLLAAITAMLFLCSCAAMDKNDVSNMEGISGKKYHKSSKKQLVRLTVYWQKGHGTDRWSRKGISATGDKLLEGLSAAADPRIFPYGTRLFIEGVGDRVVMDTGTAVCRRTAAKRHGSSAPVVDLFFNKRKDALEFAENNPLFVYVVTLKES